MLDIKNVTKVFNKGSVNEKKALDNFSLHLDRGEFVTVIGSNGAGKSTLFSAIAGSFLPDSGKVMLDGQNLTLMPEHKRSHFIGRIFQDPMKGTAPGLTIEENLALAYRRNSGKGFSFGISRADRDYFREKLKELNLGLEDRLKTKVGILSGGQRQAVTLLMATLVTPKLLLLDEHTAALDPATAEKVLEVTRKIVAENNITSMMITHNISSALELGSRSIMMDEGGIVMDISGPERDSMTVEKLIAEFKTKSQKIFDNDRMLLEV